MATSFATALALLCNVAAARPVPAWDYESLHEQADLVILASVVSTRRLIGDEHVPDEWRDTVTAHETTLRVVLKLKGDPREKQLRVVHCLTTSEARRRVTNGPYDIKFRLAGPRGEDPEDADGDTPSPTYMVFLRARDDRRYEPVSGPVDSGFSVFEVRTLPINVE